MKDAYVVRHIGSGVAQMMRDQNPGHFESVEAAAESIGYSLGAGWSLSYRVDLVSVPDETELLPWIDRALWRNPLACAVADTFERVRRVPNGTEEWRAAMNAFEAKVVELVAATSGSPRRTVP